MPGPNPWPRDGIFKPRPGVWFAPSVETKPGAYWKVEWHHHPSTGNIYTCTCPAGQNRGQMAPTNVKAERDPAHLAKPCRHVLAILRAEQNDGYPPRPKGQVIAGDFVD